MVLKNPSLGHGTIKGGMFSFAVAGERKEVKPQSVPNIRVATMRADHRLGDISVNLLFM